MSNNGLQYLLVEANRVKLGGYTRIPLTFINSALDLFYSSNTRGSSYLSSKFLSLADGSDFISVRDLLKDGIVHTKAYLETSSSNSMLKSIYLMANTQDIYAELAFVLMLLGVVNTKDMMCVFRDVGFIISKFGIGTAVSRKVVNDLFDDLYLTPGKYADFMCMLVENVCSGVGYGFTVYDFINHAYRYEKLKNPGVNAYKRSVEKFKKLEISNWEPFQIMSKAMLSKYKEELCLMMPLLYGRINLPLEVMVRLFGLVDVDMYGSVLLDSTFVSLVNPGVSESG